MEDICTICKKESSRTSQCIECQYVYCADTCMNYGPVVPTSFLCPDCSSCRRHECKMAMSKRQPLQVTVLILHIKALSAMSGHLMNIMQSALESYGVKSVFQFMTLDACIKSTVELEAFLGSIERKGVLLVMLMTKTTEGGWWVAESHGSNYCMDERGLLQRLFCEDRLVHKRMNHIRFPMLFILSCGGNLDAAKVKDLHDWNKSNRCFLHMFAFLSTALQWAEVNGFFARLMMSAFGRYEPFHRAVVEAWCLDGRTRSHSGMVWWTVEDKTPFALREHKRRNPLGVPLPDVGQNCGCTPDDEEEWKVIGWLTRDPEVRLGSAFLLNSRCCHFRMEMKLLERPPKTYDLHGVTYVYSTWPGQGQFLHLGRRKGDPAKRSSSGGEDTGAIKLSRGNESQVQKRAHGSDDFSGPSKRREVKHEGLSE